MSPISVVDELFTIFSTIVGYLSIPFTWYDSNGALLYSVTLFELLGYVIAISIAFVVIRALIKGD